MLADFSSSVANSRSRAFRKSICAQEKVPTNLYKYALGGIRTHETDLYQARGKPNTPPGRPAVYTLNQVLPTSPLVVEAAGQRYMQTMQFLYLGGLIDANANIMPEIKRRLRLA